MEIILSNGAICKIDSEVYSQISKNKWTAKVNKNHIYAYRQIKNKTTGKLEQILLHRFLMGAPKGMDVDHIDGDTLNNCKSNLRICTRSENLANSNKHKDRIHKLPKGVEYSKNRTKKYAARIMCNGRRYFLGRFTTIDEAKEAYNNKAIELFGDYFRG